MTVVQEIQQTIVKPSCLSSEKKSENKLKKEVLIDGHLYDVTGWAKIHPGGRVIDYYTETGEDASIAFQQFHHRSIKKVDAIKNCLRHRPATKDDYGMDPEELKRHKSLTEGIKKLHEEFLAEGLYNPSLSHVITRIFEFLLYLIVGVVILQQDSSTQILRRTVGILFLAVSYARVVWLAHETGHCSLTGNPSVDAVLHSFLYGFGNGLSSKWWNNNHSKHHAMPHRIKRDIDLDTLPLVAFTTKTCDKPEDGRNFFIRHQSQLFLPLNTFVVTLRWMFQLHPRYCIYKSNYLDLTFMALHYIVIPQVGIVNFLIAKWLWSMYMLGNFALNHTHLKVAEKPHHWAEYAFQYTINIESNWFIDWWMGFLNFQIEHHLFPTMPEFRHRITSERIRKFAQEHALPYKVLSYLEAVKVTWANLHNVSNELNSEVENHFD